MVTAAHFCAQGDGIGKRVNLLDQADEALPPQFPAVIEIGPPDKRLGYLLQGHTLELVIFQVA